MHYSYNMISSYFFIMCDIAFDLFVYVCCTIKIAHVDIRSYEKGYYQTLHV